jgi:hypothetical protein
MPAGIEPERGTAQNAEPNQPLHLTGRALAASDSPGSLRPAPQVNWAFGISKSGSFLVGNGKAWLLIAAGTLTGLAAGAGLGRYVLNVLTTPVGSASPATQDNATNNVSCFDTSGHKVSFVTVEPDVQLEVLDWGGTGETLVAVRLCLLPVGLASATRPLPSTRGSGGTVRR